MTYDSRCYNKILPNVYNPPIWMAVALRKFATHPPLPDLLTRSARPFEGGKKY